MSRTYRRRHDARYAGTAENYVDSSMVRRSRDAEQAFYARWAHDVLGLPCHVGEVIHVPERTIPPRWEEALPVVLPAYSYVKKGHDSFCLPRHVSRCFSRQYWWFSLIGRTDSKSSFPYVRNRLAYTPSRRKKPHRRIVHRRVRRMNDRAIWDDPDCAIYEDPRRHLNHHRRDVV